MAWKLWLPGRLEAELPVPHSQAELGNEPNVSCGIRFWLLRNWHMPHVNFAGDGVGYEGCAVFIEFGDCRLDFT